MESVLLSLYMNGDYQYVEDYFGSDESVIDNLLTKYVDAYLESHVKKYNNDYNESSLYFSEESNIIAYTNEIFEKRKYRLFKKFIERGVSLNKRPKNSDYENHTYLEQAIYLTEYDIALWLIENGANVTFSSARNAIFFLPKTQCKTILSYVTDVNMQNDSGNTLLHFSVIDGNITAFRYLLKQRNANPYVTNIYDVSPFSIIINDGAVGYDETYKFVKYIIGSKSSKNNSSNINVHDVWLTPSSYNDICNNISNTNNYDILEQNIHYGEYILSCKDFHLALSYSQYELKTLFVNYVKKIDNIMNIIPQPIAEELVLFINMLD